MIPYIVIKHNAVENDFLIKSACSIKDAFLEIEKYLKLFFEKENLKNDNLDTLHKFYKFNFLGILNNGIGLTIKFFANNQWNDYDEKMIENIYNKKTNLYNKIMYQCAYENHKEYELIFNETKKYHFEDYENIINNIKKMKINCYYNDLCFSEEISTLEQTEIFYIELNIENNKLFVICECKYFVRGCYSEGCMKSEVDKVNIITNSTKKIVNIKKIFEIILIYENMVKHDYFSRHRVCFEMLLDKIDKIIEIPNKYFPEM